MEPIKKKKAGRELGNAAACGAIAGVSWESYQWYVRTGKPEGNPAPAHVEIDNETGQRMYPLKEVRAWHAKRPGRGNWGGIGAKARHREDDAKSPGRRSPQTPAERAAEAYRARQELAAATVTSDTLAANAVTSDTLQAQTVTTGSIPGE